MSNLNFDAAKMYLHMLAAHDQAGWCFQTIDDSPAKRSGMAEVINCEPNELDSTLAYLGERNAAGCGVFVTICRTDGNGRCLPNIIGLRALFVDADDVPRPSKWHQTPDMVVWRSPIRWHGYFLINENEKDLSVFSAGQKALAKFYHTDSKVFDLPRVMRVPGFFHMKWKPEMVYLELFDAISLDDLAGDSTGSGLQTDYHLWPKAKDCVIE